MKAASMGAATRRSRSRAQAHSRRAGARPGVSPQHTYQAATTAGSTRAPRLYLVDVARPAATAPAASQRRPPPCAARSSSTRASSEKAVAGTSVTAMCEYFTCSGSTARNTRRQQAYGAAVGVAAQAVDEVHRGRAEGHGQQAAEQEVDALVQHQRGGPQKVGVMQQRPHRRGRPVQGRQQVEPERRVVEPVRVEVAAGHVEGLGHDGALVRVQEVVRQAPGDAVQAQREGQAEHGQQGQLPGTQTAAQRRRARRARRGPRPAELCRVRARHAGLVPGPRARSRQEGWRRPWLSASLPTVAFALTATVWCS